jgi:hypothetical protein
LFEYLKIFKGFPGWTLTNSFLVIFLAAGVMRAVMGQIERIENKNQSKVGASKTTSASLIAQPALKPTMKDDGNNEN